MEVHVLKTKEEKSLAEIKPGQCFFVKNLLGNHDLHLRVRGEYFESLDARIVSARLSDGEVWVIAESDYQKRTFQVVEGVKAVL